MGTARKKMTETAMARSRIYGLLATVFRAEPDSAFLKALQDPDLSRIFSELSIELGDQLQGKSEQDDRSEQLAIEYTRLFLGPGPHISAHESVFVEVDGDRGGLWGEKTGEVKKFIETAGLVYDSDYTGIPDHVSVELEFLQKLAEWEADKWAEDDAENAVYCLKVQKKFLDEHLLKWAPELCDKVMDMADLPFYGEMAAVTKQFLEFEHETINRRLALNQ